MSCRTTQSDSSTDRAACYSALQAIDEVNASDLPVSLVPHMGNPAGQFANYAALGAEMLAAGIRHVAGCSTSSSRKEIIPLFEKADALLWFPSHYERFESSPNVSTRAGGQPASSPGCRIPDDP